MIEIPGAAYLYTLATLAISYAGFAALFILFRQDLRGKLVHYDAFLIQAVVQKGFIVAGCAMLPSLLTYAEVRTALIWKISSAVAGILQLLFLLGWIRRRRRIKGLPTTPPLVINLAAQVVLGIGLLFAAAGIAYPSELAVFLVGVTAILFLSIFAYQEALVFLLHDAPTSSRDAKAEG
jgi:hypothetical protein